ncbi:unnamed protein product, partial [Trichogramma brassicae]
VCVEFTSGVAPASRRHSVTRYTKLLTPITSDADLKAVALRPSALRIARRPRGLPHDRLFFELRGDL